MRINDFSYILIRQFKYLIWLMFFLHVVENKSVIRVILIS